MKTLILSIALLTAGSLAGLIRAQDTVGGDLKQAGHDTKNAATTATEDTKKGTKKTAHATKHGVKKGANKTADKTERGADKVKEKTEDTSPK